VQRFGGRQPLGFSRRDRRRHPLCKSRFANSLRDAVLCQVAAKDTSFRISRHQLFV